MQTRDIDLHLLAVIIVINALFGDDARALTGALHITDADAAERAIRQCIAEERLRFLLHATEIEVPSQSGVAGDAIGGSSLCAQARQIIGQAHHFRQFLMAAAALVEQVHLGDVGVEKTVALGLGIHQELNQCRVGHVGFGR